MKPENKSSFRVMKGSKKHPVLDSTWVDRRKANDRCKTLRDSYQGGKSKNKKMSVWIEDGQSDDPLKYRKPVKGPFTNYDPPRPPRVNGRRP